MSALLLFTERQLTPLYLAYAHCLCVIFPHWGCCLITKEVDLCWANVHDTHYRSCWREVRFRDVRMECRISYEFFPDCFFVSSDRGGRESIACFDSNYWYFFSNKTYLISVLLYSEPSALSSLFWTVCLKDYENLETAARTTWPKPKDFNTERKINLEDENAKVVEPGEVGSLRGRQ